MSWSVEYDSNLRIVVSRYADFVTNKDLREATVKAVGLAKANNTGRFLIDASQQVGGPAVFDLYDLPNLHESLGLDHRSKGALVLPAAGVPAEEDARFFETVCLNRGWQVKVFSAHREALDWLLNGDPSNKPDAGDG
jgi:hypothetical protein